MTKYEQLIKIYEENGYAPAKSYFENFIKTEKNSVSQDELIQIFMIIAKYAHINKDYDVLNKIFRLDNTSSSQNTKNEVITDWAGIEFVRFHNNRYISRRPISDEQIKRVKLTNDLTSITVDDFLKCYNDGAKLPSSKELEFLLNNAELYGILDAWKKTEITCNDPYSGDYYAISKKGKIKYEKLTFKGYGGNYISTIGANQVFRIIREFYPNKIDVNVVAGQIETY